MNNNPLVHIAQLVINRPLMVEPGKLAIIASVLDGRIGIDAAGLSPGASQFVGTREKDDSGRRKTYRTQGSTAIISVQGSLVNRYSFLDAASGFTSYEQLKDTLLRAAADPAVSAIVLDIDSPGGEAIGAFEAADVVRQVSEKKPVTAVANGMCCSAAYAIASAATTIVAAPSSVIGSIGVVLLHTDVSAAMHAAGVKPTLIHAGARKIDGNPYQPLTDDVRGELKAEVERFHDLFVDTVAKGRPITPDAIRATEARTFLGADAVKNGLADVVGSFETGLAGALSARRPARIAASAHDTAISGIQAMFGRGADAKHSDGAAAARELLGKGATPAPTNTSGLDAAAERLAAGRAGGYMPDPVGSPQFERERADGERWAREHAKHFGRPVR